jgi:hypothetical protein
MLAGDLLAGRGLFKRQPSEIHDEEAREPPPAGPRTLRRAASAERERRRRTYRVREDARDRVRSGDHRERPGSHNLHRSGSGRWNHAPHPIAIAALAAPPLFARRERIA